MKNISKDHYIMLYPSYFNSKFSRSMGRRVPKSLAVETPTMAKIDEACRKLGFKTIAEPDKAYPRMNNFKNGRVVVFCAGLKKKDLIKKIGEAMRRRGS